MVLTLTIFQIFFYGFCCWLWGGECLLRKHRKILSYICFTHALTLTILNYFLSINKLQNIKNCFFFFFFFFQKIKLLPKEVKQNFKNEFLCKTKIQWTYICLALTRKTLRDFTEASLLLTLNIHWVAWKTMFFTHTFQEVNYAESHW